jgi:uncharacterized RDD family membrane protein YckC
MGCGTALGGSASVAIPRLLPFTTEQAPAQIATIRAPLSLGYATMGERFLAFLCDAAVGVILVRAFIALSYSSSSLDFDRLQELAFLIIPASYMTLAEFFFHGSIGKKLLCIQLQTDTAEPHYPSFIQILLRESVGKFVSGAVLGLGFLAASWNAKHATWADRIASTVVVKIGYANRKLKVLLIPVLLIAYFWLAIALKEVPANYQKNLAGQLVTTESRVDELHEKIFNGLVLGELRPTEEYRNTEEYRKRMASVSSALDEYNRLLATEEELVKKSGRLIKENDSYDSDRLLKYIKVIRLRHEIVRLIQQHVQMVLAFDPQKQSWDELAREHKEMLSEINQRSNRINQIGGTFVPRKITFQMR